jgi:hypothetical protein
MKSIHEAASVKLSKDNGHDIDFEQLSFYKKILVLTKSLFKESQHNIVFPLCFFGCMIIRLFYVLASSFLMLWVTSFISTG